jgi:hypothetical protein
MMATTTIRSTTGSGVSVREDLADPRAQAFWLLRAGFALAPVLFGIDKFFNWMVDWPKYLAPRFNDVIPGNAHQAMLIVGVIEIVAGVVVAIRPRIGAYVVAAWLAGIIVNLLVLGNYYDVALRDLGLMFGALALARLSAVYDTRKPANQYAHDQRS